MILAWLSAAFVLGVILGSWHVLPAVLTAGLACVFLAGAYLARRQPWAAAPLALAALCLGLSRAPAPHRSSPADLSYYNGRYARVQGVIVAEPDVRDTGVNYVVDAHKVTVAGHSRDVSGRLQLHTPRSQQLEYGEAVDLTGRLQSPQNSAAAPFRDIFAHRGIYTEMRFPRVIDMGSAPRGGLGWIVPLRQRLEDGIDAWLPEPEAALLIAITLGAKSASLGHLTPVLVKTGLIHIIAISGIKVALVAAMLFWAARLPGRRLVALVVPLAGLLLYVLLTGATVSGERSALMWSLIFLAWYLGRGTVALVSLCAVAASMVAVDPSLPWDIGFQLTTIGTFAIVAFTDPLIQRCPLVPSPLREALCVTVSAQIGTLPIVAVGWHIVTALGPLANAVVLPLLPLLLIVGFALGACATLPALAAPLAALAFALLHFVAWLATQLAALPGAFPDATVSPQFVGGYYAVLGGTARHFLRRANWAPLGRYPTRARELSLALFLAAGALTLSLSRADAQPHARLYWLGSGSALLLRSGDETVLVDGSDRPFSLLEDIAAVLPFDTRTIDLVIVTDPRASNLAGLQEVLRHYAVSEVLDVGAEYPSATYARWLAGLQRAAVPVYQLRTGTSSRLGAVQLTALGPDGLYPDPKDCIALLRVSAGTHTILLAGSASEREQQEALFRPVQLRADTLFLDGTSGYDRRFIRAVHPRMLLSRAPVTGPFQTRRLGEGQEFALDL